MQRSAVDILVFSVVLLTPTTSSPDAPNTFQTLFPDQTRLYTYSFSTNVTTGIVTPTEDGSFWTLDGRLSVQVYDEFGRARFELGDLKTSAHSKHGESSHQSPEAVDYLTRPWEVGVCFSSIHAESEPVWVTNVKRAITFNFLVAAPKSYLGTYHTDEPCLYGNCVTVYSRVGAKTRKYHSLVDYKRNRLSTYEQGCQPNGSAEMYYRPTYSEDTSYIMTAERLYEIDEKRGLKSLELKSDFQYSTHEHIFAVTTVVSLRYEDDKPAETIQKLNLTEVKMQYVTHSHSNPFNGIRSPTQGGLKNRTHEQLLTIAKKGIDADNIVRNASLIHSLDFIELLTTMSQLDYPSLSELFGDLCGTSYEMETSKNIFLEVLPYVRTDACAKLIRYLVVEQKTKIEDMTLVSLIRKLPYNLVDYKLSLLEELEVFTKLGPDYPQEIRHAGILSFATLVYKTMEVSFDQQYFDDIYSKYLRMYNNYPQYIDRLVWLQGLTNIGKSVVNYLDEIHTDTNKERHERLWAALASLSIWRGSSLVNTLPILMNETEHIQLRVLAIHGFLSTAPIGSRDFMNVHDYVQRCSNDQLKRFWYTTVKSLMDNRFFNRYRSASYYIPFVANQVTNPGHQYWATNNYIVSQEPSLDLPGPTFQLLTVGGPWSGPPEMAMVDFNTGGEQAFHVTIYIIAEGVTSNVYRRLQNFNASERNVNDLLQLLQKMKVQIIDAEKFHVDIVVKIQDKTVYATHIDQARFESWNVEDVRKSIEDFVRFGSHINQQIVYYPIQIAKDYPTELGTPIRFLSTILSFTSLRGNLTAPFNDEDLTWRNDLHIRYQGTSVISLSTDGPLQPSEHTARIQQSMVVHLPIKVDISVSPIARSFEVIWTNPAQSGGIAMHSRTQIAVDLNEGKDVYTVTNKNQRENNVEGIFFDCDHPLSGPEFSQLLTSKSYSILSSLQPSHFILNTLRLMSSPTSGSCGLILPPRQLQTGNKVKFEVSLDDIVWDGDDVSRRKAGDKVSKGKMVKEITNDDNRDEFGEGDKMSEFILGINDTKRKPIENRDVKEAIEVENGTRIQNYTDKKITSGNNDNKKQGYRNKMRVKLSYALNYYRNTTDDNVDSYLLISGFTEIESDGKNGGVIIEVTSQQPYAMDPASRLFKLCLREHHDIVDQPFDIDFTPYPGSYEGHITLNFSSGPDASCSEPNSKLELNFNRTSQDEGRMKLLEIQGYGEQLPVLNLAVTGLEHSELLELLDTFNNHLSGQETICSAVLKEENGIATVSVNGSEEVELKSNILWFFDGYTTLQTLRKLGLYHECSIQGSQVRTFSGSTVKMPTWYYETLAVGECTQSPRFAVTLKYPNGVASVYTGGDSGGASYHGNTAHGDDFRITTADNAMLIRSKLTGVYVYQKLDEQTTVLIPHAYMHTACGLCLGHEYSSEDNLND